MRERTSYYLSLGVFVKNITGEIKFLYSAAPMFVVSMMFKSSVYWRKLFKCMYKYTECILHCFLLIKKQSFIIV